MPIPLLARLFLLAALSVLPAITYCAQSIAPFEIVCGDLPPFAIEAQPQTPGALVELSEQIAQKLGQPQKAKFVPWARALVLAQNQARTVVVPVTRTPERENQFTWIVKMASQRFGPISKANNANPIQTLEHMMPMRIVVMRGSPTYDYLIKRNFKPEQIMVESTIENMFKALDKGLVDVIYGSEQINSAVIASSGRQLSNYYIGNTISLGEVWLAGSKDFSAAEIQSMQQAMAELQVDGSYTRLMKKYKLKP